MTLTRVVKPSDSPPLGGGDIARVQSLLSTLRKHLEHNHSADSSFSIPAMGWKRGDTGPYTLYERLAVCDPVLLRFFRFMCMCFSGYSVYHCSVAEGLTFPDTINADTADRHWDHAAFPDQHYSTHMRQTFCVPPGLIFQPPLRLGEAGWIKNNRFISIDQLFYQERLSLMYFAGLIEYLEKQIAERGEARILEIGGGYGALAFAIKQYLPAASYTIVDLPESLSFSGTYLTLMRPDLKISVGLNSCPFGYRLVPVGLAQELNEQFDLVINTLSMAEMSEYQVEKYCRLMKAIWIKEDGFFFEQNFDDRSVGWTYAEPIIERQLERHVSNLRPGFEVLRGKPTIWKNPAAMSKVALNVQFPSMDPVKILEIGNKYTVYRSGIEYLVAQAGQVVGRELSLENVYRMVG